MAITINGSGTVTGLSAGGLPDGSVQQTDLAANVATTGPAFHVYQTVAQNITGDNTFRVIALDTKSFDTASRFNNTNATVNGIPPYAFMPNVPGYYAVGGVFSANVSADNYCQPDIYKNGVAYASGGPAAAGAAGGLYSGMNMSTFVFLNGTTDYIDLRFSFNSQPSVGTVRQTITGVALCALWGYLVRSA